MFSSLRRKVKPLMGMVAVTVLLAACSKFDNDNNTNNPAAALMTFNLAPDQSAIGVELSGNNLTNAPLAYTNYTGNYQLVFPGTRSVLSFGFPSDSTLATRDFNFVQDKYYSLFVTGANGNYSNVISQDNFDSLTRTAGKSYLRFINAIADSSKPLVKVTAPSTDLFNENVGFNTVSDFKVVDAGNVDVAVTNNGNINATRTLTLDEGKVYTVLLVGQPGATDDAKKVQVKFITNGSLPANQ